ncbi:DUF7529 family protein [Halorubrum yunnanense]|uniref:Uncharacterized protein n=1 Tax=Halorubrum yunnanense TaxID=1526162 RepID=A0ABD5YFQ6_9EURY|nr:hypothetical protein [Halorubrum yunnanense]
MSAETPLTAAWNRLRETVTSVAAEHRTDGRTVVEAYADHGAVRSATGEPLTFVFTVPGDATTALRRAVAPTEVRRTEVRYVDIDGYRLYVLEIHQADDSPVALVAGGIRQRSLREQADTAGRARTVVRSLDDTVALELRHDTRTPFLTELK